MMALDTSILGAAMVGGSFIVLFLSLSRTLWTTYRLPPSPPTNSIMGHRLPEKNSFLTYESWFQHYGPLISLRAGMDRYVVIGRHKAAMEIMEKQGSALADRPRLVACGELLGRGLRILLTPPGERLSRMRRALHTHFQPKAVKTYQSVQVLHAKRVLLGLLENPARFQDHARAYAASVIINITYGRNMPTRASHPDVLAVRMSLRRFVIALRPGAYLVDSLPWLKYIPWYGRDLRQGFVEDRKLFHRLLDAVKFQTSDNDSGPSFVKFLLSREIDFGMDETEMAFLAGSLFSAGSQTTALAICVAMMAAAFHPDVQTAVHAELDGVVGNGQLPTFDDEESLPVLRAFIMESTRWRPLSPLGFAHRATEDITCGDYCIPAGTTVYGNLWGISRDPEVFPDPDKFDLTRWLTPDGKVKDDVKFPYFGFGRRVCPGQHVANRSVYISMAFVLWAFDIFVDESKPVDDLGFVGDIVRNPDPIGLRFKPRVPTEILRAMIEE